MNVMDADAVRFEDLTFLSLDEIEDPNSFEAAPHKRYLVSLGS